MKLLEKIIAKITKKIISQKKLINNNKLFFDLKLLKKNIDKIIKKIKKLFNKSFYNYLKDLIEIEIYFSFSFHVFYRMAANATLSDVPAILALSVCLAGMDE